MSQINSILTIAAKLGIPYAWLYNLIKFESGLNPLAKNKNSSARGLIQFIDSTAQSLGYKNSLDLITKHPDIDSQMAGPVYSYLKKYAPFKTEQSLYMSVFYPVARTWPLDKEFPASVQKVNPGIKTVRDYVNKVRGYNAIAKTSPIVIAIAGYILYKLFRG